MSAYSRIYQYGIDRAKLRAHRQIVPERDVNEEASRQVNEITGSGPVNGEDLIESEDLKRQLREAKKRINLPENQAGT